MKIKNLNIKFILKAAMILLMLLNTNLSFSNNFVNEKPEFVKAWEVLLEHKSLRTNVGD